MADGRILESQITASSRFSEVTDRPQLARLNHEGCWRRAFGDNNPWLKVDFLTPTLITNILTQGSKDRPHWVRIFTVSVSNDDILFHPYEEDEQVKVRQVLLKSLLRMRRICIISIVFVLYRMRPQPRIMARINRRKSRGSFLFSIWFKI